MTSIRCWVEEERVPWYETTAKNYVFDNRLVLERYCLADVTLLGEASRTLRRTFLQIGNVEVQGVQKSFPDYEHLLQENYVEYKYIFLKM
jgi:hypothetical protein